MQHTIDIAAGAHGFGDGRHPTTAGMLAALEAIDPDLFRPGIACDMGAGSGILSFAIHTRFGCPVVAVELDRQAAETLQQNADANGFGGAVEAVHSDGFAHPRVAERAPYDLIVMNILAEPLMRLAVTAQQHLAAGGVLLISGLLLWQEDEIRQAYQSLGLELAARLTVGEWVTLSFQKPEA